MAHHSSGLSTVVLFLSSITNSGLGILCLWKPRQDLHYA
jgi:hypothetical protein